MDRRRLRDLIRHHRFDAIHGLLVSTSSPPAAAARPWCGSQFSGWGFHPHLGNRTAAPAVPVTPPSAPASTTPAASRWTAALTASVQDGREQSSPPDGKFISVSAGSEHTCGVKEDGTAVCWGNSAAGRPQRRIEVRACGLSGDLHACGLTSHPGGTVQHKIVCWGASSGSGRTNDVSRSQAILAVSAGADHNCEVYRYYYDERYSDRNDGWRVQVRCWGNNSAGQLANFLALALWFCGDSCCWRRAYLLAARQRCGWLPRGQHLRPAHGAGPQRQMTPTRVLTFSPPSPRARTNTCAIDGANGNARADARKRPVLGQQLAGPVPSRQMIRTSLPITAGAYHTCGLKSDGTVRCWGDNNYGQGAGRPVRAFRLRSRTTLPGLSRRRCGGLANSCRFSS